MNAQTLDGFTVPALKAIARDRKLTGYSRMRRAELVALILADNEVMETQIKAEMRKPAVALNDFPAVDFRPITEAHVKICADRGHATYVIDGVDQGFCPRCGDFTPEYLAKAIEQEKALAEIEPFESPIALCGDNEETVSDTIVIAPVQLQIPAMLSEYGYSAHGNTYAVDYNRIHEEMHGRKAVAAMRMSHSDPIDDVIRFARQGIAALMATLSATKLAFESLRDDESANPNHVDLAYQAYADTHRAIEEYRRTIAYAAGEHDCGSHYREVGMTEECAYGCKIYRCGKCQDESTLHNATYGCKGI